MIEARKGGFEILRVNFESVRRIRKSREIRIENVRGLDIVIPPDISLMNAVKLVKCLKEGKEYDTVVSIKSITSAQHRLPL